MFGIVFTYFPSLLFTLIYLSKIGFGRFRGKISWPSPGRHPKKYWKRSIIFKDHSTRRRIMVRIVGMLLLLRNLVRNRGFDQMWRAGRFAGYQKGVPLLVIASTSERWLGWRFHLLLRQGLCPWWDESVWWFRWKFRREHVVGSDGIIVRQMRRRCRYQERDPVPDGTTIAQWRLATRRD